MPPIANQGRAGAASRGGAHEVQPRSRATGLGGRRPARAGAEVVDAGLARAAGGLGGVVGGAPQQDVLARHAPRPRHRQVVLAQVQHVDARGQGDVGAVVGGDQRPVAARGVAEGGERVELVARLDVLVAQLDHVHPPAQGRVGEVGEVAPVAPGVGAQVEAGVGQALEAGGTGGGGGGRGAHRSPTVARPVRVELLIP